MPLFFANLSGEPHILLQKRDATCYHVIFKSYSHYCLTLPYMFYMVFIPISLSDWVMTCHNRNSLPVPQLFPQGPVETGASHHVSCPSDIIARWYHVHSRPKTPLRTSGLTYAMLPQDAILGNRTVQLQKIAMKDWHEIPRSNHLFCSVLAPCALAHASAAAHSLSTACLNNLII